MLNEYLIDRILPAYQIHLLGGASGAGKTTFLLQYLRQALDGGDWFGHKCNRMRLAYIACDRRQQEYDEKFQLMGIKPFEVSSLLGNPGYDPLT